MSRESTALAPARRPLPTTAETIIGVAFMAAGFFFYSVSDMLAKVLTQSLHPIQIAWVRQLGLLTGVLFLLGFHGPPVLRSSQPFLQIMRGVTVVVAAASFILSVTYVPLADAVAVTFVAPFIVTVLAALVLGERIGYRRWIAVFVGFISTIVIIRPGAGVFNPAIMLALVAGTAFAIRQILTRLMSGRDSLATTITYSGLTAFIVLALPQPFFWKTPESGTEYLLMAALAICAGVGEFAIMRALELAEAVMVAPLQYSLIIWSTIWGFLVFSQLPDIWTFAGVAAIMISGIYTFYREARKAPG